MMSLNSAPNAIFDSAVIVGAEAACLRGTQNDILNTIQDWAENPDGEIIFWLHGMAGTGKTSVALAVANALNERQPFTDGRKAPRAAFLGASFFFKQGDRTRNTTERFFTTLARSLAQEFADLRVHIANAVAKNLDIGSKAPQQQLSGLIVRPVSVIDSETLLPVRLVVVVDALDECINHEEVDNLIGMLRTLEELHQVQIRVLITSRRDNHIETGFNNLPAALYRRLPLPKIPLFDKEGEVDDITFYLIHTLRTIARKRGAPPGCIDQDGIARLSRKADGLFIYASTLCRFLDTEEFEDEKSRHERLKQIFDDEVGAEAPQQKVDEIYLKVLAFPHLAKASSGHKKRFYDRVTNILGFITILFEPASIASLSALLPLDVVKLEKDLRKLYSVLDVREDRNAPLALVHLSFRDFLLDKERCGSLPFQIEEVPMHRAVFERCLQVMADHLSQDMCGLALPGRTVASVPRDQVDKGIPRHVQYACRYWVDHLQNLDAEQRRGVGLVDDGAVQVFFRKRLLFWLEAMSLLREGATVVLMLNSLDKMVDVSYQPLIPHGTQQLTPLLSVCPQATECPDLSNLIYDSKRFVLANRWILDNTPMQLYPAIIFSPAKSRVRRNFEHLVAPWIIQKPVVSHDWNPNYSLLEIPFIHGSSMRGMPIAFSPVGSLLVWGFQESTRIWDHSTGTELYRFDEERSVSSVAFSADGKRVVSAVGNGTLRIRDFAKGTFVDLGDNIYVQHVGFLSRTNNLLVAVDSNYICIWNIDEKRAVRTTRLPEDESHCRCVLSPSSEFMINLPDYSFPPGVMVRSCTTDDVWTKVEHRECVRALCISPDGNTALSADYAEIEGYPRRVRVWDVGTGMVRREFPVNDLMHLAVTQQMGGLVAVAIGHATAHIELRRLDTWHLVGCVVTTGRLYDLLFSPDGNILASTSHNGEVRLWDITLMKPERPAPNPPHDGCMISIANVPGEDENTISVGSGQAFLWGSSGTLIREVPRRVSELVVSGQGGLIGAGHCHGVHLWNKCMIQELLDSSTARDITISPDGGHAFLRLDYTGRCRIVSTSTLEELQLQLPEWLNSGCIFSPNGRYFCWIVRAGVSDDLFCLLDLQNGKLLKSLIGVPRPSDLSSRVTDEIIAEYGAQFEEWDSIVEMLLEAGMGSVPTVLRVTRPDDTELFLASYPAGRVFATSLGGTAIGVNERGSGRRISTLSMDGARTLKAVAISPTGKLAAAAQLTDVRNMWSPGEPFNIYLWDISSGAEIGRYSIKALPFEHTIENMSFSSDAQYLEAKLGRLPLPRTVDRQGPAPQEKLPEVSVSSLYQEGYWLVQEFENLLWIPREYREVWPAFKGPKVVFGHRKGMVSVLKLDLTKTPVADQARARHVRHGLS